MDVKEIFKRIVEIVKGLSLTNRIILGGVVCIVLLGILASISKSKETTYTSLFHRPLSMDEYASITQSLEKMKVDFKTRDDRYVLVQDEETGRKVRMKLAQEGQLPSSVKSWEIFDMNDWTTTDFDRDVKLRRALMGQMRKHLESLEWIERVDISLTMPEKKLYTSETQDASVSVSITPSPGFREYLSDKKKIKGLEMIILRGIDGLKAENIVVTDDTGVQLNDFKMDELNDRIKEVYEERKIITKEKEKIKSDIEKALLGILSHDRYRIVVDLDMNFSKQTEKRKEILPVVIKERTPGLAYDDSQVLPSVKVSEKIGDEEFRGQGYIPEGPPGQEANVPPGYKDNIDRWNQYNKKEQINNYTNGERHVETVRDPVEIVKKSVAVIVDGTWDFERDAQGNLVKEAGGYKRRYTPFPVEDLKKLEEMLQAQVGFDRKRGDQVVVKNIQFDRKADFQKQDREIERAEDIKRAVFLGAIMLFSFFVLVFVGGLIRNEMKRRKRQREIELEMERQREVEESLRTLMNDEQAVSDKVSESAKILEQIIEVVNKEPETVAKLLKNWILE